MVFPILPRAVRTDAKAAIKRAEELAERIREGLGGGRVLPCRPPSDMFPVLAAYVEGLTGRRLFEYWVFEVEDTDDGTKEEDNDS